MSVLLFFLRSRRPPRSTRTDTLCPYTTLFRSLVAALRGVDREDLRLALLLPSATVLRRPLALPLAARDNLLQVVAFEMDRQTPRSEEHTSELQSLMRISYAVFCVKKKTNDNAPINKLT